MRKAATSANVLRLPAASGVTLEVVNGRQVPVRHGIFLSVVSGKLRTCYAQLDGEIILADECKCRIDWLAWTGVEEGVSFRIVRLAACPIDAHKQMFLHEMREVEA